MFLIIRKIYLLLYRTHVNYCYHPITRSEFREGAWTWPISKTAQENNTLITLNNYWE